MLVLLNNNTKEFITINIRSKDFITGKRVVNEKIRKTIKEFQGERVSLMDVDGLRYKMSRFWIGGCRISIIKMLFNGMYIANKYNWEFNDIELIFFTGERFKFKNYIELKLDNDGLLEKWLTSKSDSHSDDIDINDFAN